MITFKVEIELLRKDIAEGHLDAMGDTTNAPPVYYAALVNRVFSKYWGKLTTQREPHTNGYELITSLYTREPSRRLTPRFYIVAKMDYWGGGTGTFRLYSSKDIKAPLKEFTAKLHPDAEGDPWTHIGALLSYTRTRLDEAIETDPVTLDKVEVCTRIAKGLLGDGASEEEVLKGAAKLMHMTERDLYRLAASIRSQEVS